jgi:hypothetical protein
VHRSVLTVVVKAVKRKTLNNPLCDLQHILVLNNKVAGGTQTLANEAPISLKFTSGVLVKVMRDSFVDLTP